MLYSIHKFKGGDCMSKVNIHVVLKTQEKIYDYELPGIYKEEDKTLVEEGEEEDIINTRISEGHMVMDGMKICPTRKFYDYVQDVLADTYVKLAEDKRE